MPSPSVPDVASGDSASVDSPALGSRPIRHLSIRTLVVTPAIWLIRGYQMVVSPMRPPTCRFYPSCSAYALTAIERFGIIRGSWLAARRLLRCHPWNPGGVDHVPLAFGFHDATTSTRHTHQT